MFFAGQPAGAQAARGRSRAAAAGQAGGPSFEDILAGMGVAATTGAATDPRARDPARRRGPRLDGREGRDRGAQPS